MVELNEKQADFVFSNSHLVMYIAGFGSGKSYSGVFKNIVAKLKNPDSNFWFLEPTYAMISNIAIPEFQNQLDALNIPYELNKSGPWIRLQNQRGKIHFRSMNEPARLVGENISMATLDEIDTLKEETALEVFQKVLGRLRQKREDGVDPQICLTSTPEGFRMAYRLWSENKHKTQEQFHFIQASTLENKFLPQSYIDSLRSFYTPELLKAYLNGEFVNLKGNTVYSYFDRSQVFPIEMPGNKTLHIGQDFNVGANVSIVTWVHENEIKILDTIVAKDTFETKRILLEKYPDYDIHIYPDASGNNRTANATLTNIDILREKFTVHVRKSNPRIIERVGVLNKLFQEQRISIDGKNEELILALEQQIFDDNGLPEKSNLHPGNDDYLDALGYMVFFMFHPKGTKMKNLISTRRFG
jgi:PBSX family phage terminase large subunit